MSELLLDTHTFIWYINGDATLSVYAKNKITNALHRNAAYLAAISLWEICMLHKRQRIILDMPCQEWIDKALQITHIQTLALSSMIANESCQLPGDFHGDPADQMIVATARVENLTLVTRDKQILNYSRNKYLTTIKA